MQKADCYHLGYIAKLHGFKGEVSFFLDVTDPFEYEGLKQVYVDINGFLTPFFIKSINLRPKGFATVKLEGVETENDAQSLVRKNLYLPLADLPQLSDKNFYDHEVVGFELVDINHGLVGVIQQIIDLPVNPLIQVDAKGKEVLIPFVKGLIQRVDRSTKTLHVQAPEGLIGIYLD
ncbi:MAG: 16S rRNA processing protein RimM [Crocinitomicaceae bacterium]|nr:16S rRNA processing protein RimM [Crocinitomicaceae bacterium]